MSQPPPYWGQGFTPVSSHSQDPRSAESPAGPAPSFGNDQSHLELQIPGTHTLPPPQLWQHPSLSLPTQKPLQRRNSESSSDNSSPASQHLEGREPKPYGRPTPCAGCREWRRKCNLGNPCERCLERGIDCVYVRDKPDSRRSVSGGLVSAGLPPPPQVDQHQTHNQDQLPKVWNPMAITTIIDQNAGFCSSLRGVGTGSPSSTTRSSPLTSQPTNNTGRQRPAVRAVSCKSCHQRKIKCDKLKPSCSTCSDRGQACEYYL
ncbi:hypothetical protein BC830DRAFT_28831 [Chytriomyces sp. MP71]|nr:hypothetical protein BC830DRAFT_28831 [Chytriomyces sp. MP71]